VEDHVRIRIGDAIDCLEPLPSRVELALDVVVRNTISYTSAWNDGSPAASAAA